MTELSTPVAQTPRDMTLNDRARASLGRRNLIFVGLMGAGKSAIGRLVAQSLSIPFVDTDVEIERVSRMSISELFSSYGCCLGASGAFNRSEGIRTVTSRSRGSTKKTRATMLP